MADLKSTEKEIKETLKKEKEALNKAYEDILQRLKSEGSRLQDELKSEYDDARKYVRDNPETGLGIALAGGILVGILLTKLLDR